MSFPAYPSYRGSGVDWLQHLPSDWKVTRVKTLFEIKKNIAGDLGHDVLSITQSGIKVRDIDSNDGQLSMDYSKYQLVSPGDFAMNHMDLITGWIDISHQHGVTSPDYRVFKPRATDAIDARFYLYLFHMAYSERLFYPFGQGSSQLGRWRLPTDAFNAFPLPLPPKGEQIAISVFLDSETAKIDALIEEQRCLIALLKEKRQAVISQAVTKGLHPHAPMKDSGVEWLGEVPAHWEVKPVKSLAALAGRIGFRGYTTADLVDEGEGAVTLSPSNIVSGEISYQKCTYISWEKFEESPEIIVEPNDIVIVKTGSTYGRVGYFGPKTVPPTTINPQLLLLKRVRCKPEFLFHSLNAPHVQSLIRVNNTGGTIPTVTQEFIGNLDIPVPPENEQLLILKALDDKTAGFHNLIADAENALILLKERRAALISAAVTGKIDVRGSAIVLPFPIDRTRARGLVATEIIERSAGQATFGRVKFQKIAFLAEGHVGISELAGSYTREAAGPLDRALIDEMESGASNIAGIVADQQGGTGTAVRYRLGQHRGAHRQELADWLGVDRTAKLDKLIIDFAPLTTKQAEAVATLYGVWSDALSDGNSPTEDEIIAGFLNDWHPEKREKFRASELPEWLGWMRRHGIVPSGSGPRTTTGRLFI